MINNCFSKIYCVNLDKRPNRWEQAKIEFEKHNLEVERFSATDGCSIKIQSNIPRGALGCSSSHMNIIKKAQDENLDKVLIFEDDVVFIENLQKRFEECYNELPENWDMFYFGGNHNNKHQLYNFSKNLRKIGNTYSTHAYAIRNTIYDLAISRVSGFKQEVDVCYAQIQKERNCYVCWPHLAWQRPGFSDVMGTNVNYHFLK